MVVLLEYRHVVQCQDVDILDCGTQFKADLHMPCRDHAIPLPHHAALIHTCHAGPLPFSYTAMSFVQVHVVARNIRTASRTV
jgi:hypothetical protein